MDFGCLPFKRNSSWVVRLDKPVNGLPDRSAEPSARAFGVSSGRGLTTKPGGCTVNLVRPDRVPAFGEEIAHRYHKATGLKPDIYVTEPMEGTRHLAGSWVGLLYLES